MALYINKLTVFLSLVYTFLLFSCTGPDPVVVCYDVDSEILSYGVEKLSAQLHSSGYKVRKCATTAKAERSRRSSASIQIQVVDLAPPTKPEGYRISREGNAVLISGRSAKGCLYGIMDLLEQIGPTGDLSLVGEVEVEPALSFRAIKFNLPWSPYRPGPATELHSETCRDLGFWEAFLDMMVENRFNALTLWNTHPFPYMIRAKNYPKATPFTDEELNEWKQFWRSIFRMARVRGIETYIVNWNIVVSPEFAGEYGTEELNDLSDLVKKYTRESVTQLINEYEDLTGLGVTLADWMGNWGDLKMTPQDREDWIQDTFVEGIKDARRKVKFIHRAVLAGDPMEMRRVIDYAGLPEKTIVEVKFNWSHGHSTPRLSLTHSNDQGTIMRGFWDPPPANYFIAWMIRNEDFFVLRWGDPEFIREHIRLNHHAYVDGYFIGSEGYIPAVDYSHKEDHPHKTWQYDFEKHWFFYRLWGRLTYDPVVSDERLALAFRHKYGEEMEGRKLLKAYSLASKVPLHIASFYKGTWDFTLYCEGFLSAWPTGFDDGNSPFISIEELIRHETLDPHYMGIAEYCRGGKEIRSERDEFISPLELAQLVQDGCTEAGDLVRELREYDGDPALASELDDLEAWCHLGHYFADKLRAGVALEKYHIQGQNQDWDQAIQYLEKGITHWEHLIGCTKDRYKPMPYVSMGHPAQRWPDFTAFHWEFFLDDVKADLDHVRKLRIHNEQ